MCIWFVDVLVMLGKVQWMLLMVQMQIPRVDTALTSDSYLSLLQLMQLLCKVFQMLTAG